MLGTRRNWFYFKISNKKSCRFEIHLTGFFVCWANSMLITQSFLLRSEKEQTTLLSTYIVLIVVCMPFWPGAGVETRMLRKRFIVPWLERACFKSLCHMPFLTSPSFLELSTWPPDHLPERNKAPHYPFPYIKLLHKFASNVIFQKGHS